VIGALLLTALLPLITAMVLANSAIRRLSEAAFQPSFRTQLDRSLVLYRDLAESMRRGMELEATSIAASDALVVSLSHASPEGVRVALERVREAHPNLLSLSVLESDDVRLASVTREVPLDPRMEQPFKVRRALLGSSRALEFVFAADRRRLDDAAAAREFAIAYEGLERVYAEATRDRAHALSFAGLLGFTVVLAVLVGAWVVRPVTRRIDALLDATRPVAEGDLSVRVLEDVDGDFAPLARAFNAMLEQLEKSRARIEFLRRVGQWQTVARRLAHEIKNPLTPIQLAVEECCQRYRGDDTNYRELLETTRDIVTEEVSSLRTLVGEFAAFARLPRANLRSGDLSEFLREAWPRLLRDELPDVTGRAVVLELELGSDPLSVAFDRTMLHRMLVNLISNAKQATGEARREGQGRVWVRASRVGEHALLVVEDDGPGIADVLKAAVFDPYVTTRKTGTGLGLSIVQKIVLDHGGSVEIEDRADGGARFTVRFPIVGTDASDAALSKSHAAAWSGSGSQPGTR
jgi:two-component system nitrogen regulation sensor histidine kinase NtrY